MSNIRFPTPFDIHDWHVKGINTPDENSDELRDLIVLRMLRGQWSLGVCLQQQSTPANPLGQPGPMRPNTDFVPVPMSMFDPVVDRETSTVTALRPTAETLEVLRGFAEDGRWFIRVKEYFKPGCYPADLKVVLLYGVMDDVRDADGVVQTDDGTSYIRKDGCCFDRGSRVIAVFSPARPVMPQDQRPISHGKTYVDELNDGSGVRFLIAASSKRQTTKPVKGAHPKPAPKPKGPAQTKPSRGMHIATGLSVQSAIKSFAVRDTPIKWLAPTQKRKAVDEPIDSNKKVKVE